MEWHETDARSLAIIDREMGDRNLSPAERAIVQRVIYATADFDYADILRFSERSLHAGAAALAARTTLIVDVPTVQVGISRTIQGAFANPVYCGMETVTRPQKDRTQAAWGIRTLAQRYPEGIFVIGQAQTALAELLDMVEAEEAKPALIVGTPAGFIDTDVVKDRLKDVQTPYISTVGRKGSAVVAAAIVEGLIDLAWQAYGKPQEG